MFPTRTQRYVEAIIELGDKFDHSAWLKRVREEEAAATTNVAVISGESNPINETPPKCEPKGLFWVKSKAPGSYRVTRSVPRSGKSVLYPRRKSVLSERIGEVKAAWATMKQKHARDAMFGYLEAVFQLAMLYSLNGQTENFVRRVLKLEGLPDQKMDVFAAIIRCTSEKVDRKTTSRWSRALRYAAYHKDSETALRKFIVEAGGINACADRFTLTLGRGRQVRDCNDRNSD